MKKAFACVAVLLSIESALMQDALAERASLEERTKRTMPLDGLQREPEAHEEVCLQHNFVVPLRHESLGGAMAVTGKANDAADAPEPQTGSQGTQKPAKPHKHEVRNLLIIVALGAVLYVALAVAGGK